MGLIADSSVFIRAERMGKSDPLAGIPVDEESGISAITVSELLEGIHHAASPALAKRRRARFDAMVARVSVFPFTSEIAEVHAELRADLRRRGEMIGAHDLIIAATAIHLGWPVLTTDVDDFKRISRLSVIAL